MPQFPNTLSKKSSIKDALLDEVDNNNNNSQVKNVSLPEYKSQIYDNPSLITEEISQPSYKSSIKQVNSINSIKSPKFNFDNHQHSIPADNYDQAEKIWEEFVAAQEAEPILLNFKKIRELLRITPNFINFDATFSVLKGCLKNWKTQKLFKELEKFTDNSCYFPEKKTKYASKTVSSGLGRVPDIPQPTFSDSEIRLDPNERSCKDVNCLIVGAGPVGLRFAIEMSLLGANTAVVEARTGFTRNNVVHLWNSVVTDLKKIGLKYFYNQFGTRDLNHIAIERLQSSLMKISLIFGVDIHLGVKYDNSKHPDQDKNRPWKPMTTPALPLDCPIHHRIDILIGADGKRTKVPGFSMKTLKGRLSLGITANLALAGNDTNVDEIAGKAYQFHQKFFQDLKNIHDITLENIVYYRREHHYFVMTCKKSSLLERGVINKDLPAAELLTWNNIDVRELEKYARDAINYSTEGQLSHCSWMKNTRGENDIAIFDFTEMWKAEHSSITRQSCSGGRLLLTQLIGDALLNPFWPMGTGVGRGFQGAFDAAWLCKKFFEAYKKFSKTEFEIEAKQEIAKRELSYNSIYTSLDKCNDDLLEAKYHTLDPSTRYRYYNNVIQKFSAKLGDQHWYSDKAAKESLARPSIAVNPSSIDGVMITSPDLKRPRLNDRSGFTATGSGLESKITTRKKSSRIPNLGTSILGHSGPQISTQGKIDINSVTEDILPRISARIGQNTIYNYKVENLTTDWNNGHLLAALVHSFDNNLFNLSDKVKMNTKSELIKFILGIIENHYGYKMPIRHTELLFLGQSGKVEKKNSYKIANDVEVKFAWSLMSLLKIPHRKAKNNSNEKRQIINSRDRNYDITMSDNLDDGDDPLNYSILQDQLLPEMKSDKRVDMSKRSMTNLDTGLGDDKMDGSWNDAFINDIYREDEVSKYEKNVERRLSRPLRLDSIISDPAASSAETLTWKRENLEGPLGGPGEIVSPVKTNINISATTPSCNSVGSSDPLINKTDKEIFILMKSDKNAGGLHNFEQEADDILIKDCQVVTPDKHGRTPVASSTHHPKYNISFQTDYNELMEADICYRQYLMVLICFFTLILSTAIGFVIGLNKSAAEEFRQVQEMHTIEYSYGQVYEPGIGSSDFINELNDNVIQPIGHLEPPQVNHSKPINNPIKEMGNVVMSSLTNNILKKEDPISSTNAPTDSVPTVIYEDNWYDSFTDFTTTHGYIQH